MSSGTSWLVPHLGPSLGSPTTKQVSGSVCKCYEWVAGTTILFIFTHAQQVVSFRMVGPLSCASLSLLQGLTWFLYFFLGEQVKCCTHKSAESSVQRCQTTSQVRGSSNSSWNSVTRTSPSSHPRYERKSTRLPGPQRASNSLEASARLLSLGMTHANKTHHVLRPLGSP